MHGTEPTNPDGPWAHDRPVIDRTAPRGPPLSATGRSAADLRRRMTAALWLLFAVQLTSTVAFGVFVFKLVFGK